VVDESGNGNWNGNGSGNGNNGNDSEDDVVIENEEIPLAGPIHSNNNSSWALINLILSIFSAIAALYITIRTLLAKRRKGQNEKNTEAGNDNSAAAGKDESSAKIEIDESNIEAGNDDNSAKAEKDENNSETKKDENDNHKEYNSPLCLIISIATALIAIVLFAITQSMGHSMVWLDWWTIAHILLFATGLIATLSAGQSESKVQVNDIAEINDKVEVNNKDDEKGETKGGEI